MSELRVWSRPRGERLRRACHSFRKKLLTESPPAKMHWRVVRKWRGKTQLYISHKTSIGQDYISDLESGRRRGTTAALKKIADMLKVPDLLPNFPPVIS
jgi:predicted transcriptional regulator